MTFSVFAVFVVVTFYESFALFAGYCFFNSYASIHNLVLSCVENFGSSFFAFFETLFEGLFHFFEETGFVATALISMT